MGFNSGFKALNVPASALGTQTANGGTGVLCLSVQANRGASIQAASGRCLHCHTSGRCLHCHTSGRCLHCHTTQNPISPRKKQTQKRLEFPNVAKPHITAFLIMTPCSPVGVYKIYVGMYRFPLRNTVWK